MGRIEEDASGLMERIGLSGVFGKIYTLLLTAVRPLTMKEISRRTGYSLASVSTGLNTMLRLHMVSRAKSGGVYVYRAMKDTVQVYREHLQILITNDIIPLQRRLREAMSRERDPSTRREISRMLDETSKFRLFVERMLTGERSGGGTG